MKTRRDSILEWSLLQTESLKVVDFAVRSGFRIGVLPVAQPGQRTSMGCATLLNVG